MSKRLHLFIHSAMLERHEPGKTISKLVLSYRVADSREQAVGSFVEYLRREFPDRSVSELLTSEVASGHVEKVADTYAHNRRNSEAKSYPVGWGLDDSRNPNWRPTPSGHDADCAWQLDQYEHECTCGASARNRVKSESK